MKHSRAASRKTVTDVLLERGTSCFFGKIVGKEAGVPSASCTDPVFKEQQAYGQTDDCSKDTFNQSVTRQTFNHDSGEFLNKSCFQDPVYPVVF